MCGESLETRLAVGGESLGMRLIVHGESLRMRLVYITNAYYCH